MSRVASPLLGNRCYGNAQQPSARLGVDRERGAEADHGVKGITEPKTRTGSGNEK